MDRLRIKFCGMTRQEDIHHAAKLGADAIGLIFYPASPRYTTVADASNILHNKPLFLDVVAVVVNPTTEAVFQIINELPVDYLQFHGEETPEFCQQFKRPYIKAIPATSTQQIESDIARYQTAAAILLDTPSPNKGGTGLTFAWDMIPTHLQKPILLAGGLNPDNISAAVKTVKPYAVDVNSGVESSAGIKDHDKMNKIVQAVWGGA